MLGIGCLMLITAPPGHLLGCLRPSGEYHAADETQPFAGQDFRRGTRLPPAGDFAGSGFAENGDDKPLPAGFGQLRRAGTDKSADCLASRQAGWSNVDLGRLWLD